jgi:hypothetical protein
MDDDAKRDNENAENHEQDVPPDRDEPKQSEVPEPGAEEGEPIEPPD